jgi:transposase
MNVRYRVELSQAEREELTAMLSGGKHAARKLKRAQILLAADIGSRDEEIARTVRVSASTVYRTKRRFVEGNLDRALSEEPRPGAERKLTGKEEALLVATACAKPPAGRRRWTLALLADVMVKLTDHDSLSGETVRRRLADNDLNVWSGRALQEVFVDLANAVLHQCIRSLIGALAPDHHAGKTDPPSSSHPLADLGGQTKLRHR